MGRGKDRSDRERDGDGDKERARQIEKFSILCCSHKPCWLYLWRATPASKLHHADSRHRHPYLFFRLQVLARVWQDAREEEGDAMSSFNARVASPRPCCFE